MFAESIGMSGCVESLLLIGGCLSVPGSSDPDVADVGSKAERFAANIGGASGFGGAGSPDRLPGLRSRLDGLQQYGHGKARVCCLGLSERSAPSFCSMNVGSDVPRIHTSYGEHEHNVLQANDGSNSHSAITDRE